MNKEIEGKRERREERGRERERERERERTINIAYLRTLLLEIDLKRFDSFEMDICPLLENSV